MAMFFDKLADAIVNHAKIILAIWIVIMIVAVPFALKSGEVMNYDVNDMADEDSESIQGMAIVSQYFPSSEGDVSTIPVLVIEYQDEAGLISAEELVNELNKHAAEYVDADGNPKLDLSQGAAFVEMSPTSETGPGILMVGVLYTDPSIASDDTPDLRAFIHQYADGFDDIGAYLTGTPAISYDTMNGAMQDIQRIDPFTILLILVLVGLFFRSFITSATPPITIGVAFVVVLALIFGIGQVLNIFFITEMMLLVSMMGAGCDYCIFIIARYKEELRSGKDHKAALHEAVKWAGESIAISGASVIIGFGAMSICSFSLVSTMGICLALGILVALMAALTLIPSILAIVGDRIFWPSRMDSYREGGKSTKGWYAWCGRVGQRYFERSSRFSLNHAKAIVIVAVLVTVPAAYVALTSETSYDMIGSMQNGESGTGMDLMGEYANEGMLMPDYVVMEFDQPIATVTIDPLTGYSGLVWTDYWTDTVKPLIESLSADIIETDMEYGESNVASVSSVYSWQDVLMGVMTTGLTDPELIFDTAVSASGTAGMYVQAAMQETAQTIVTMSGGTMTMEQAVPMAKSMLLTSEYYPVVDYAVNCAGGVVGGDYVDSATGGSATYLKLSVATYDAAMSPRSMDTIQAMNSAVDDFAAANPGLVLGTWVTGTGVVMYEISENISSEFNSIELLVIVLILILLFVVMRSYTIPFRSVLTILMSICWTLAATHLVFVNLLGGEVMWLIPLILLVICLGLGMDYDILLTTRIKENVRSRGMSNDEAIHQAVLHTGSVITICGLIMGGAFGTLMLSGMEMMQEFGFALCFAILVDALLVRTYIVPAVMHLLGDWNWKGPGYRKSKPVESVSEEQAE